MKQTEVLAYTYEFISMLLEEELIKNALKKIVLFGSVARDDFSEKSDVDIFVELTELSNANKTESIIKEKINRFEIIAEKTWALRGINLPIKVIVGKVGDETWASLKDEIKQYGITLYGEYKEYVENYALISYSLNQLKQRQKMSFLRRMYGYKNTKNKKVYTKTGLLSTLNAVKTAANQCIVKADQVKTIIHLLKEFSLQYKIKKIHILE